MPKVVTELDLELAKLRLRTEEARGHFRQLQKDAEKISLGDKLFGSMKGLAAGAGIAGAVAAIRGVFSELDDLADMSLKLNESPETLQRVGAAAAMSGSSVETLADAMLRLERGLGDAGNEKAREALARFGFSAEQILALPLDQKIIALADAFQKARAEGHGLADIQAMMGKNAAELIPLLSQGGEGLRSLFQDVRVVSDEAVQRMAEINDQFELAMTNLTSFGKGYVAFYAGKFQEWGASIKSIWDDDAMDEMVRKRIAKADESRERKRRMTEMRQSVAEAAKAHDPFAVLESHRAKEDEAREAKIESLKKEIEAGRIGLLPDGERLTALEGKLRDATKRLQEAVADPFTESFADLLADVGRLADDNPLLERALLAVKEVQDIQRQINSARGGAAGGGQGEMPAERVVYHAKGAVASQFDWLAGQSSPLVERRELESNTRAMGELKKEVAALKQKLANVNVVPAFGP